LKAVNMAEEQAAGFHKGAFLNEVKLSIMRKNGLFFVFTLVISPSSERLNSRQLPRNTLSFKNSELSLS